MTERGRQRLSRCDRLRERRDYQRVSQIGVRVNSQTFILLAAPRRGADESSSTRLGITASRRVGSAVQRSLVKRRIREWFRRHREEVPMSRDIVVIARAEAARATCARIDEELSAGARQICAMLQRQSAQV